MGATTRMSPALALLDGDVNHPVVARRHADRDRGAGDVRAAVDGAHVWRHEAGALLGFVDGCDAEGSERLDDAALDALHVSHHH